LDGYTPYPLYSSINDHPFFPVEQQMNLRAGFSLVLIVLATSSFAQTADQTKVQTTGIVTVPNATQSEIVSASQAERAAVYATPPTLTLIPHSPQAHPGDVWLRSTDDGLHVWVRVQADGEFQLPQQKSEMLSSDHMEVWLATSADVTMPAIGWGNHGGTTTLDSPKDCEDEFHTSNDGIAVRNCERWYSEQLQYRQYLKRLFVRQWLIANSKLSNDSHSFEDFASTAYSALGANLYREDLPASLQPKPDDGFVANIWPETRQETRRHAAGQAYAYGHQTGYNVHLFIPYTAFPPAQQLKLQDLYLMVDVFRSAPADRKMGDYSTTSPARQWGKPSTFNHLRLASPRKFQITPCRDEPRQTDLYDKSYASWFFPAQSSKDTYLSSTFALINPANGYMYNPAGVSPEVAQSTYFWRQLANGVAVCGPHLAWSDGTTIKRTKFSIDAKYFEAKTLPDGWSLLRSGPFTSTHSRFGSGECGACEIMGFNLFAVSPQGDITSALDIAQDLSGENGQPQGADLAIDPDWKRITLYREFEAWTSISYCLEGHAYKQCGKSKLAKVPEPANFKEFREND
jgi:hypothetical protein